MGIASSTGGRSRPGGGLAIFLAACTVIGVILLLPNPGTSPSSKTGATSPASSGGAGVVALGLVDDWHGIRGRHKLLGQIAVAGILVATGGLAIQKVGIFGIEIELGRLAIPVTIFWLVGAINAINLLDGIDGLATTLGILLSITLAVMAFMTNHVLVAAVAMIFAGSLLGFLRFNFPPATIFLGDAGSMLIGLMVGGLAIHSSLKGPITVLLAAPLAALTIPILDSSAAIIRRRLTGRSIYTADRGHLHHRLFEALGTNRKVLGVVALACVVTSTGSLLSVATKSDILAIIAAVSVVVIFATTGLFGRGEMLLVAMRVRRAASSLAHPLVPRSERTIRTSVRLQGRQHWDQLWEDLTETAERMQLDRVHLDINLPLIQESYNATWDRPVPPSPEDRWKMDFPLIVCGRSVGRLTIAGNSTGAGTASHIDLIRELLAPLESRLIALSEAALAIPVKDPEPSSVALAMAAAAEGGSVSAAANRSTGGSGIHHRRNGNGNGSNSGIHKRASGSGIHARATAGTGSGIHSRGQSQVIDSTILPHHPR